MPVAAAAWVFGILAVAAVAYIIFCAYEDDWQVTQQQRVGARYIAATPNDARPQQQRVGARRNTRPPSPEPEHCNRTRPTRRQQAVEPTACSICIDDLRKRYNVAAPCGHKFHHDCYGELLAKGINVCPNCRSPI